MASRAGEAFYFAFGVVDVMAIVDLLEEEGMPGIVLTSSRARWIRPAEA